MQTNFHTHTLFCDGRAEAASYAEEAVKQGISILGFSAHAPVPFPNIWTMKPEQVAAYHTEIERLKQEYKGRLEIYCGLEADYFTDILEQSQAMYAGYSWDYIIGSIHFLDIRPDGQRWCIDGSNEAFRKGWLEVMDNDPLLPIERYYENTRKMVRTMKPDIIGHMDKLKIQCHPDCLIPESHPFYRTQIMQTLEEIAASDCIVEVSTRGIQKGQTKELYPSRWVIEEMARMKIPVMVNSDAHAPDVLSYGFEMANTVLKETGYKTAVTLKDGKWTEHPL